MGLKELLLEKVSRNEIAEALRNNNVMAGAEFEFTVPKFIDKYYDNVEKFENMQDMEEEYLKYDEAFDQWMKIKDNKNPLPKPPQWALDAGYEIGEEIPPPDEIFPNMKVDKDRLFNALIKDFIPLNTLPFNNYIVSSNNKTTSKSKWVIKPDGSLGLHGVEIVTPVITLKEFLNIVPKMFEWINDNNFEVGEECGFHISMSLKNINNLGKALDVTKLAIFLDEGFIYNVFPTREFNTYAKSSHDAVVKALVGMNSSKLASKLVDDVSFKKPNDKETFGYVKEHYMAINIEHLDTPNEYIEFRYVGATNYHRKWSRIKDIVAHYIYNLSLACDPTFKRKEYEKKLARCLNKIEFVQTCMVMTEMYNDKSFNRNDPDIRRDWKSLWDIWNSLYLYKKSVDADTDTKHGRKGFLRLLSMVGMKENDIIWDWKNMKYLK